MSDPKLNLDLCLMAMRKKICYVEWRRDCIVEDMRQDRIYCGQYVKKRRKINIDMIIENNTIVPIFDENSIRYFNEYDKNYYSF